MQEELKKIQKMMNIFSEKYGAGIKVELLSRLT